MNQAVARNPIVSFFVGLWDIMNFTRRLILNIVFFGLLLIILIAIIAGVVSGGGVPKLTDRTTLIVAPTGSLVEQYSTDPALRALASELGGNNAAEEVQLRDLVRGIDAAAKDKNIERMMLQVDGLHANGYASIREVAAALARFRAAGKQIVAFTENMQQSQYLLAAQANEIYLDPMGGIVLEGLGRYRQYYRQGLQEKLGVDVHLFRVGEFKSAAEPYILDAASKESKEADLFWMNDIWQRYLQDIGRLRKIDPAQLTAGIDTLPEGVAAAGGDLAKFALQQKLVDGLKTQEEIEKLLTERGVADEDSDEGFRNISLGAYLAQHDATNLSIGDSRPQIAVVIAEGEITDGEQPPGTVGGKSTAGLLREARDDEDVKAVVLRVNSPGGGVYPSEEIRREVEAIKKEGKPVVVSMGDLAASGGYWISMNADRIYADPSTITGSIGIFGLIPNITRSLNKIGVHTDGVGTTRFAGAFDISRPLDPAVGQVIQSVIDKGYADFTGKVATARNKPVAEIDAIARGRVWSGAQGKERGIVDELGGMQAALDDAAKRAKLGSSEDYRVRYIETEGPPLAQFFSRFAATQMGEALLKNSSLVRGMLAVVSPEIDAQLRFVQEASNPRKGMPVKALAYCFCGL